MSYYDEDSDSDDADSYYPRQRKPHYPDHTKSVQYTPDSTPSELDDDGYQNPTPQEPSYHNKCNNGEVQHGNGTDREDETGGEWRLSAQ